MDENPILEAGVPAQTPAVLGVFVISCKKCTRSYELHGTEERLARALEAEGWIREGDGMVCPHGCYAVRETPVYNKAREQARRCQ